MFYRPINWKQGMLMKPHHFQHTDLYQISTNWKVIQQNSIYAWGVISSIIDDSVTSSGRLDFQELEIIFPDGSWVKKNVNAIIEPAKFSAEKLGKGNFMVFVGIHKYSLTTNNVSAVEQGASLAETDTRFISLINGSDLANLYENDMPSNVQTLHYAVKIFTSETINNAKDYLVVPVVALKKKESGDIVEAEDFTPPVIQVGNSKLITGKLRNVYKNLTNSIRQLESFKMKDVDANKLSTENILAYMTPTLIKYRLALQVLVRYMSTIKGFLMEKRVHPFMVYDCLRALATELTAFSLRVSALSVEEPEVPIGVNYDHLDLTNTFAGIAVFIKSMLDEIVISEEKIITFNQEGEDAFVANIPEGFLKLNERLYLVVLTREPVDSWLNEFKFFAKVAAGSRVRELVDRSLPGLEITELKDPPPGMPIRQNAHYFALEQTGEIWQEIYTSRTIGIIWDTPPTDLKLDLTVSGG